MIKALENLSNRITVNYEEKRDKVQLFGICTVGYLA